MTVLATFASPGWNACLTWTSYNQTATKTVLSPLSLLSSAFLPISSFIVLLRHLPLLLDCSPGYGTGSALVRPCSGQERYPLRGTGHAHTVPCVGIFLPCRPWGRCQEPVLGVNLWSQLADEHKKHKEAQPDVLFGLLWLFPFENMYNLSI